MGSKKKSKKVTKKTVKAKAPPAQVKISVTLAERPFTPYSKEQQIGKKVKK